jgi:hypothetical protein
MIMSPLFEKSAVALSIIASAFLAYCTMAWTSPTGDLVTHAIIVGFAINIWSSLSTLSRIGVIRRSLRQEDKSKIKRSLVSDDLSTIVAAISVLFFVYCTASLIISLASLNLSQKIIACSIVVGSGIFTIWSLVHFHRLAFPPPESGRGSGDTASD